MKGLQPGCSSTENKEKLTEMPLSKSHRNTADTHQFRKNPREGTIFQRQNSETVFSIVTGS